MIRVEIWSDIACPFCLLGKRMFEAALKIFPHRDQVMVLWRSFELDPKAERESTESLNELLAKKYGKPIQWAQQKNESLARQANEVGIQFHFDNVVPTNTFDAHRLMHFSRSHGLEAALQERLFKAYFTEGLNIGDHEVLVRLGKDVGLNAQDVRQVLESRNFEGEVRADEQAAAMVGVTGVPAFDFNEKYLITGAQSLENYLKVLEQVWSEQKVLDS